MLLRYFKFIISHFTSVHTLGRISRFQSFFFCSKFFLSITSRTPITNFITALKVKLYAFYNKNKDLILNLFIEFKNKSIVKLFLKSLIIENLFLILTKMIIGEYLNIWSRILLLALYIGIAMRLDLREKIKFPLAIMLRFCLGSIFVTHSDDLDKWDAYIEALPEGAFTKKGFRKFLYTIKFELFWFIQYLFQRFYIGLNYIRLCFDANPIIYIIIYYNVLLGVIYYNIAYVISYIGLCLVSSKLLIYFSENNFSEVKIKLTAAGFNLRLQKKTLKISKNNAFFILEYSRVF